MKHRGFLIIGLAFCNVALCQAQRLDTRKSHSELGEFVREMTEDFDNFRHQSMAQFAEFVRNPWKEFEETPPLPIPLPNRVPPVIMDEDKDKPIEDKPVVIEEVVEPIVVQPQPQPVEPIEEVPVEKTKYLDFAIFGTPEKVRLGTGKLPFLEGLDENSVASMLGQLCEEEFDNLIYDCLNIRQNRQFSDWAYLQMLNEISKAAYPRDSNSANLLMAYLYLQSGYRMRLANDGTNLYMLYASKHEIYEKESFLLDGERYYGLYQLPDKLRISLAAYPNEQSLSLLIDKPQKFSYLTSENRSIHSDKYENIKLDVAVNKNLMDFYSTYPTSCLDGNLLTRWAMYANTPMDEKTSSVLYPQLKEILEGKTNTEAVNMLLNLIQTGFVYEFDDKIWGKDRAFFSEESFYYPYCDCEDRSILLTRIVRDILGLQCVLVYYPGHLASAIEFPDEDVKGDYVMLGGSKYVIADPTYINAPLGYTMPGMDNASAKVILLK